MSTKTYNKNISLYICPFKDYFIQIYKIRNLLLQYSISITFCHFLESADKFGRKRGKIPVSYQIDFSLGTIYSCVPKCSDVIVI